MIYKVTSPSGKIYVGQTCNFENRKRAHKSDANSNDNRPICYAIRKYGDQLKWEVVLSGLSKEEANSHERQLIQELNSVKPNGYNIALGGEGFEAGHVPWNKGLCNHLSPKTKSQWKKGYGKCNQNAAKRVIDIESTRIYGSVKEAAIAIGVNRYTLAHWLNGTSPNKSTLRYQE